MSSYILQRVLIQIGLLFLIALIGFSIIHVIPGNPASIMLGENATQQRIDEVIQELGLDRPIHVQFVSWMKNVLSGNLGRSIIMKDSVASLLIRRFPRTFWLAIFATSITLLVGVPMGITAALHHNSFWDRLIMIICTAFLSIPIFVLALYLMLIFAVELRWFPVAGGYVSPLQDFPGSLRGMFLPALSISSMSLAYLARMTRSSMLEVMNHDYIQTARAKGLKETKVILKHMLKNAAIPIVSSLGLILGGLLGGTIISEMVFVVPGIGKLMYESVLSRDYVVMQALILLVGISYSLVNLLTDLIYAMIDPRISYS